MLKSKRFWTGLGLLVCMGIRTGFCGSISGQIKDAVSGIPLPDVEILVKGTHAHAVSGDGGFYAIENISEGEYTVQARVLGYAPKTMGRVQVKDKITLDFSLYPKPLWMNPVIVTGTRWDHLQSHVSVSSTILMRAQMLEQNGHTAAEVLKTTEGVFVKDYGGFAGLKTLSIRGSGDAQVLVLLDGQRLNSAQDGGMDVSIFPVEMLEKIEIVRGGHSAIVGTDAMGGAIHLFTPNPKGKLGYGIYSMVGSFGTQSVSSYLTYGLGSLDLYGTYGQTQSDGNFTYTIPHTSISKTRENNDFRGKNLLLKARYRFGISGHIQALYHETHSKRGSADPIHWESTSGRRNEDQRIASLLWEEQLTAKFRLHTQASFRKHFQHYFSPYENDRHENTTTTLETYGLYSLNPNLMLTGGGEIRKDDLESTKLDTRNRTSASLSFQAEWSAKKNTNLDMKWMPALRWEYASQWGAVWCPKMGILFWPMENLSLKANLGKSFRVPTFNDLYWPEIIWPGYGGTKGNPDLKPETSWGGDIGWTWTIGEKNQMRLVCTYFQNRFQNLIQWESDSLMVWAPRNVGKAKIWGVETAWSVHFANDRFWFTMAPTWMKSHDEIQKTSLVYRPKFKADFGTGCKLWKMLMYFNYEYVDKRKVRAHTNLPSYSVLDGNIQYRFHWLGMQIRAKLQVNNLLNKSITIVEGYPIPGREFRVIFDFQK